MFSRNPDVCGGALVIQGTRVGVEFLAYWLKQYNGDVKAVQQVYPHLTIEQIEAVKEWAEDTEKLFRRTAPEVLKPKGVSEDGLRDIISAYKEAEVGIPYPGGFNRTRRTYSSEEVKQINRRLAEMKVMCGRYATELYMQFILDDDTGLSAQQKHFLWLAILKVDEARMEMEGRNLRGEWDETNCDTLGYCSTGFVG